jgi:hypothetical protein
VGYDGGMTEKGGYGRWAGLLAADAWKEMAGSAAGRIRSGLEALVLIGVSWWLDLAPEATVPSRQVALNLFIGLLGVLILEFLVFSPWRVWRNEVDRLEKAEGDLGQATAKLLALEKAHLPLAERRQGFLAVTDEIIVRLRDIHQRANEQGTVVEAVSDLEALVPVLVGILREALIQQSRAEVLLKVTIPRKEDPPEYLKKPGHAPAQVAAFIQTVERLEAEAQHDCSSLLRNEYHPRTLPECMKAAKGSAT